MPWLQFSVVEIGRQRSGCCNRNLFSDRALTDCGVKRLGPSPNALFKLWRYRHRCQRLHGKHGREKQGAFGNRIP